MTICGVSAFAKCWPSALDKRRGPETTDTSTTMSKPGEVLRRVCVVEILSLSNLLRRKAESKKDGLECSMH